MFRVLGFLVLGLGCFRVFVVLVARIELGVYGILFLVDVGVLGLKRQLEGATQYARGATFKESKPNRLVSAVPPSLQTLYIGLGGLRK